MTDGLRRVLVSKINTEVAAMTDACTELKAKYGQIWNTKELQEDYTVHGFMAPFVKVTRKRDNVDGLLMFSHEPRWYFEFEPQAHDRSSGITISSSL